MRKKVSIFVLSGFAFALTVFNFSMDENNHGTHPLTLANISALQASAGEATCGNTNSSDCCMGTNCFNCGPLSVTP